MTLQLNHTTWHITNFSAVITKLAISWSVNSFVAFLLVNVKTLAECLSI